jgi:hypothetical protein
VSIKVKMMHRYTCFLNHFKWTNEFNVLLALNMKWNSATETTSEYGEKW